MCTVWPDIHMLVCMQLLLLLLSLFKTADWLGCIPSVFNDQLTSLWSPNTVLCYCTSYHGMEFKKILLKAEIICLHKSLGNSSTIMLYLFGPSSYLASWIFALFTLCNSFWSKLICNAYYCVHTLWAMVVNLHLEVGRLVGGAEWSVWKVDSNPNWDSYSSLYKQLVQVKAVAIVLAVCYYSQSAYS